jgi:hypothetical protein
MNLGCYEMAFGVANAMASGKLMVATDVFDKYCV